MARQGMLCTEKSEQEGERHDTHELGSRKITDCNTALRIRQPRPAATGRRRQGKAAPRKNQWKTQTKTGDTHNSRQLQGMFSYCTPNGCKRRKSAKVQMHQMWRKGTCGAQEKTITYKLPRNTRLSKMRHNRVTDFASQSSCMHEH